MNTASDIAVSKRDNRWRAHFRATVALGLPLIGSQLTQIAIHVTDTVMIGRLGSTELAASVLAMQFFFTVFIFGMGFALAVMPLVATAEGEGDDRRVRQSVRMGLWVVLGYSILAIPVLWFSKAILLKLGQAEVTATLAQDYLRVALWGMFPALTIMVLRSYLSSLELAGIVLWSTIIALVLNAVLDYAFIFGEWGAPRMEVTGAAVASAGSNLAGMLFLVGYTLRAKGLKKYHLYTRIWRINPSALSEVFRLGWPIGATLLAEIGLFAMSSVMMGWVGIVPLAAHGIAMQIISVIFMIPLGLASAATIRVGNALGRNDPLGLDRAAKVVYVLSLIVATLAAILLLVIPEPLIGLYLNAERPDAAEILAVGVPLLAVAAAFQVFDITQVVSANVLRGIQDTRAPMLIAVLSYWVIGVPSSYILAFKVGLGGVGVWTGLAIGLAVAAVLLTTRFAMRDRLGIVPEPRMAAVPA
jgi:MATE family, multidrug efflux pump